MAIPINKAKVDAINAKINPWTITKEQLWQQVKDTYAKWIATWKTREEVIWAMKNQLQTSWQYDAMKQVATWIAPPTQDQLKAKIETGNFTASEARQYNQITWSQTWARDLALTSKEWIQNLNTTITPEETAKIAQAWITNVWEWVKPDLTTSNKEDFKQALDTTKVTKQETPTWTVTTTETPKDTQKIESIDQFKQAGWWLSNLEQLVENRYGTVATQEQDWITAVVNGEKFKWTIDNAWNPIKTSLWRVETQTPNQIFQTLAWWWQIDTNTKWYTEAKTRFDTYSKYKDFTDKQFQTAFNEGLILPWTQLYNDLSKNPKIKLQMDKANALNRVNWEKTDSNKVFEAQSEEIWNNTKVDISWQTMSLKKAMEDWYIDKDEYSQITNTPEVISKLQEVEDLKNKADELQNIYDNVRLEVEEQLKWTWATKSDLESIVWERQKNMLGNLNLAISKYNNALWTLTELKKTNSEMFATNLWLYQKQQERIQQLEDMKASQDFSLYQNELNRQYQTEADKRNFDQQKEMLAIQDSYKEKNIPTSIIQVGNKNVLINTQTWEQIKSFDMATETMKPEWPIKMWEDSLYDPNTWKWIMKPTWLWDLRDLASQFPWQAWAKNNNPAWITWNANFDAWTWTAGLLKEAWINFSKWTARPANEWGNYVTFDTIEDWLKAQRIIMTKTYGNSTVEQMLGKWVWTWEALNYAKQVAWNAWVSLKAKVSSLSDDQISQLQMAKIQKESPWLFSILQWAWWDTTWSKTTFSRQNEPQYRNYLTTWKIWTNAEEIKQIEKEFWSVENFKKQAEAYNNSPWWPREQEINQINKIKDTLQELTKETWAISNVSGTIATALTPWGLLEKKDFLWKIQNVLDQKTLQSLIDAKWEWATFGALSNEELRMLQAVWSVLSARAIRDKETNAIKYFDMSETALKNELQKMIDMYNQNINKINVKMWKTWQVDTTWTSTNSVKWTSWNTYTW